jgi:hypothetical protein
MLERGRPEVRCDCFNSRCSGNEDVFGCFGTFFPFFAKMFGRSLIV